MLKQYSLKKISTALNNMLATHPYVSSQFAALQQKTLRITLLKTPFDLVVTFHQDGIALAAATHSQEATVQLTATPANLLRFARTKEHTQMLMEQKIQIKGDLDLLMQIKKIEQQLAIDWEGLLAEYLGDFAANRLWSLFKIAKEKITHHAKLFGADTMNWLYDDLQCLPRASEANHFYQGVRALRRDIDRFEARLKQSRRNH